METTMTDGSALRLHTDPRDDVLDGVECGGPIWPLESYVRDEFGGPVSTWCAFEMRSEPVQMPE